jgi:putative PEP-CTERM system histidine kinase
MDPSVILAFAAAVLAAALAMTVAWQQRRSKAYWSFATGMAILAVESVLSGLSTDAVLPNEIVYWEHWRLLAVSLLPGPWLLFSLTYARGNAREFLAKWRVPLAGAFIVPLALTLLCRGNLAVEVDRADSGDFWFFRLGFVGVAFYLLLLLSAVLVLMNLERTFRASVGTMRWRIKFMLIGLGVIFTARAYTSSQMLLFRAINLSLQPVNSAALLVGCLLVVRSLMRPGGFEVNVYPSHTVLRNSVTVMLAGCYLLIVGVLAKLVAFWGGTTAFTLKAFVLLVVIVTFSTLFLSERARLYAKRLLSRHFEKPEYDYRSVWKAFTLCTTRHVEQKDLCGAVARLVSELFKAMSVNIWLLDEKRENLTLGASTSVSDTKATQLALDAADAALVLALLRRNPEPLDIDASKEIGAVVLRRLHPDEFRQGGNRIAVPMLSGGDLLGVMTLGDRVGGVPFSIQEIELLTSLAEPAAACLLNVHLSQRLSQARQLEAFQAMSTFFVHDLKNTASTLSLMLQNLPIHFDDPKFREDALRGISATVTHINDLISRLSLLRQDIAGQPVESDLNSLVTEALAGQATGGSLNLIKDLRPIPKVCVDPAQIRNVVTNLLLNAREAVGPAGQIRVETTQHNGWVVLSVADNGCGMTPEFVQRSLFRPFQTTKKRGIGIGMFQCKIIVEAHRGRIEVESEPGKGSSFRVLLPVPPQSAQ